MTGQLITTGGPGPGSGDAPRPPMVLGIGGTLRAGSSSEQALRRALAAAGEYGATTELITATDLNFPMYDPDGIGPAEAAARLLDAVRRADSLIVATPGYHGGTSGLLKNALDYLQELAADPIPYIHGKAVGCIVTTSGWQAGVTTLTSLRSTVHALRGWPTPLGVVINSTTKPFGHNGELLDARVGEQLATLGEQVVAFARAQLRNAA
jgi:FMN reductase